MFQNNPRVTFGVSEQVANYIAVSTTMFSPEQRVAIGSALNESAIKNEGTGGQKLGSRCQQHCEYLHRFLTPTEWACIESAEYPRAQKISVIATRCNLIGISCPANGVLKRAAAILLLSCPDLQKVTMNDTQKKALMDEIREHIKLLDSTKRFPFAHVKHIVASPALLHANVQRHAYPDEPPLIGKELDQLEMTVKSLYYRGTAKALKSDAAAARASSSPSPPSSPPAFSLDSAPAGSYGNFGIPKDQMAMMAMRAMMGVMSGNVDFASALFASSADEQLRNFRLLPDAKRPRLAPLAPESHSPSASRSPTSPAPTEPDDPDVSKAAVSNVPGAGAVAMSTARKAPSPPTAGAPGSAAAFAPQTRVQEMEAAMIAGSSAAHDAALERRREAQQAALAARRAAAEAAKRAKVPLGAAAPKPSGRAKAKAKGKAKAKSSATAPAPPSAPEPSASSGGRGTTAGRALDPAGSEGAPPLACLGCRAAAKRRRVKHPRAMELEPLLLEPLR